MLAGQALLADHVARFNAGVRSGDFGPMVDGFTEDGELVFEGIPVGPFRGRVAIASASSSSLKVVTDTTGPKISSWKMRILLWPLKTVGFT